MKPMRDNLLNSRLAEGVRRFGFRKWYERELLSSHAHMVLVIFCVIALIGSMEAFRDAPVADKLLNVLSVIISAAIGLWALRRYLFLLMRAEEIANQATCPECAEYGRFDVLAEDQGRGETEVCCRRCSHKWVIGEGK